MKTRPSTQTLERYALEILYSRQRLRDIMWTRYNVQNVLYGAFLAIQEEDGSKARTPHGTRHMFVQDLRGLLGQGLIPIIALIGL